MRNQGIVFVMVVMGCFALTLPAGCGKDEGAVAKKDVKKESNVAARTQMFEDLEKIATEACACEDKACAEAIDDKLNKLAEKADADGLGELLASQGEDMMRKTAKCMNDLGAL